MGGCEVRVQAVVGWVVEGRVGGPGVSERWGAGGVPTSQTASELLLAARRVFFPAELQLRAVSSGPARPPSSRWTPRPGLARTEETASLPALSLAPPSGSPGPVHPTSSRSLCSPLAPPSPSPQPLPHHEVLAQLPAVARGPPPIPGPGLVSPLSVQPSREAVGRDEAEQGGGPPWGTLTRSRVCRPRCCPGRSVWGGTGHSLQRRRRRQWWRPGCAAGLPRSALEAFLPASHPLARPGGPTPHPSWHGLWGGHWASREGWQWVAACGGGMARRPAHRLLA